MSYLIDTCVISEFVKRKPNEHVRDWFNQQDERHTFISAISIAEHRCSHIALIQELTEPSEHT